MTASYKHALERKFKLQCILLPQENFHRDAQSDLLSFTSDHVYVRKIFATLSHSCHDHSPVWRSE